MNARGIHHIERVASPSPEEFERCYRAPSRPVILVDALRDWPALARWTPGYLAERFGDRRVPAAVIAGSTLEHHPSTGIPYVEVELGAYVRELTSGSPPSRYVTFALEEHLSELVHDLRPFPYARGARWSRRRIWLAPPSAASPLHQDLPENLYAQLHGSKRFWLFAPTESRRMYRFPLTSSLPNFGRVDAEHPDLARFPAFGGACGVEVVLEPGDVLYLPSLWWHQTRGIGTSLAMNLWWTSQPVLASVLRAAETYKRLRGLSI